MRKLTTGIISVIVLVAIVITLVLTKGYFINPSIIATSALSIGNSPVLGNPDAPVTIYEFSDFSCPYCQAAEGYNTQVISSLKLRSPGWDAPMLLVKAHYIDSGEVKIVFKYYPGHGAANAAHAVALALNEQNPELFWKFAEKAFAQATNLDDLNKMKAIAIGLGADEKALSDYLNSNEYEAQFNDDMQMAKDNNIQGTPTFFINGNKVEGAQSFSVFEDIIEKELGK